MDATTIGIAVAIMAGILLALVLGRAVLQTLRNAAWIIGALLSLAVILVLAVSVFQAQTTALIAVTSQTLSIAVIGLLTLLLLGASGALLYLIFRQQNQSETNPDLQLARLLAANLTLLTELTLKNRRPALPDPDDDTALSYDYEDDADTELPTLPQGWGW